jgi:DNA-directed RNA polymerase IV subunit 1
MRQHSLIELKVNILPTENVLSINPVNCIPLLGDFDGDCLYGYVPQSLACGAELSNLVSIDGQLFDSQDGRSLFHCHMTVFLLLVCLPERINI